MSDRIKGLIVTLDVDLADERADLVIGAILQLRHVVAVEGSLMDGDDIINRSRVQYELRERLFKALED